MTQMFKKEIIYPTLSYKVNGILFKVHNQLGRYCREKQYQDVIEKFLIKENIRFKREEKIPIFEEVSGNRVDFLIEDKIILECKAKRFITKEDYYQLLRYLKASNIRLGLLTNFRNRYLKPKRIVN